MSRDVVLTLYSVQVRLHLEYHVQFCPLSPRETRTYKCGPTKGHKDNEATRALLQGKADRAGMVQPGEEEAQGDLINVCKQLKGGCKETGARLFTVVLSARTRGNGCKLEYKKFPFNCRKHFFTVWVTALKYVALRGYGVSPVGKTFKSCLDVVLDNCL